MLRFLFSGLWNLVPLNPRFRGVEFAVAMGVRVLGCTGVEVFGI